MRNVNFRFTASRIKIELGLKFYKKGNENTTKNCKYVIFIKDACLLKSTFDRYEMLVEKCDPDTAVSGDTGADKSGGRITSNTVKEGVVPWRSAVNGRIV